MDKGRAGQSVHGTDHGIHGGVSDIERNLDPKWP